MRKNYFFLAFLSLSLIILFSSCSHTLYNPKVLQGNYDVRMDTKSELEIKGKVRIYLTEKEIDGEYDIISINLYKPFTFPIFMSQKGQTSKKFYEKAVKKAYKQGGNGIIVMAGGYYKVIALHNWDSDNASAGKYVNAILDTSLMDRFTNGNVAKLSPREIKRCVEDLICEIEFNLQSIKTSSEAQLLEKKIDALYKWNISLSKPDASLDKKIKIYKQMHSVLMKKITKKENKK